MAPRDQDEPLPTGKTPGDPAGAAPAAPGASSAAAPGAGAVRSPTGGRVLVVDDDHDIVRAYARRLSAAGFTIETAHDGEDAARIIEHTAFDAIVTDIRMPRLNGLDLLRLVRGRDLDVPVIFVTASPSVHTAAKAIEQGVFRYLTKPVSLLELTNSVEGAVRLCRLARLKREALDLVSDGGEGIGDRFGLEVRFERALASLWVAFQPIISWNRRSLFGFEALLRTEEASLPHPAAVLDAARRLGRLPELGRTVRSRSAIDFVGAPADATLFVNLHVSDLTETELFLRTGALAGLSRRVVLEVTEHAAIDDIADLRGRAVALRGLGFRIAIDDLGAGYSGLNSLAVLEPDVVKIDMSLVRGIHRAPMKQRIVSSMLSLCRDSSILAIAEGIETVEERDALAGLGCDLMQGYLFGRPGKPFPLPEL